MTIQPYGGLDPEEVIENQKRELEELRAKATLKADGTDSKAAEDIFGPQKVETTLEVKGNSLTRDELLRQLSLGSRVTEVTIGRKESRQKAQYQNNEYFASLKLDFSTLWNLVDECQDDEQKELSDKVRQHIHDMIMGRESYLSGLLLHFELKDGVPSWPRDPKNPAVQAENIKEAWKATR